MVQLVRQDAVSTPVPREKIDLPTTKLAAHDHIRRLAKRRLDEMLRDVGDALDLVKAAAADDADGWCCHATRDRGRERRMSNDECIGYWRNPHKPAVNSLFLISGSSRRYHDRSTSYDTPFLPFRTRSEE